MAASGTPNAQRQRTPMPMLPAALTGGTVWKMAGLNSNESRTRFAPTARRADASITPPKWAATITAPPRTPNGRALSAAGLMVSVARAAKRPISAEAQGRASSTAHRSRSGQTSSVAASSLKDTLPPCSWTPVRKAWCAASTSAGEKTDGRSRPTIVNRATPGMTRGAKPTSDSAANCAPTVNRLPEPAPSLSACVSCIPSIGTAEGGRVGELAVTAGEVARSERLASPSTELGSPSVGTDPVFAVLGWMRVPTDVGSRVTAMIKATASAASVQLRAFTWRSDGFVPGLARVTSATTAPDAAASTRARITSPSPWSTKRTRGERARTLAITSARFVQLGSALTVRFADATAALGSAAAKRSFAANANAANGRDARRAWVLISASRSIAE